MDHSPFLTQTRTTKDTVLEADGAASQAFGPLSSICAHLNAFHVFVEDVNRPAVEANHYCSHVDADLRQCLIYDSPEKNARLIGVVYIVTKNLFDMLEIEERKLWHSHDFENVPDAVWEKAETKEMEELVGTYGEKFGTWQVDKNARVPLGEPVCLGMKLGRGMRGLR